MSLSRFLPVVHSYRWEQLSGHLPWYEEPARFLSVIETFLAK